jgi:hypothetical protein
MARPERLELPACWFEASRSILLSYGRASTVISIASRTRLSITIAPMSAAAIQKRVPRANIVTFPRKLGDAIPDQELSAGRCLAFESADARGRHTEYWGRVVHVSLRVRETGRLTSVFDILAHVDIDGAEDLANLILAACEEARKAPAEPEPGSVYPKRRKR